MLSSVSLGTGLKTRPTPPNGAPNATGPSSPKQDARHSHCVTPDPSAAVEALEASLEACLKSAAALGGAAPTGAAARLASKAERLSKTIGALVVGRGRPSSTLYIVRAGRVETSYEGGQRLVGAGASFAVWKSTRGSSNVDRSRSFGTGPSASSASSVCRRCRWSTRRASCRATSFSYTGTGS